MATVGIRELKAHLSEYLREVTAGKRVLVTDRGRVVAELRRPAAEPTLDGHVEAAVVALAARGAVRLAVRPGDRAWLEPTGVRLSRAVVRGILDAERGD